MKKNTGVVRHVDEFGRISLPIEIRKTMSFEERVPVEFFIDGGEIVLKKYAPVCTFCGETEPYIEYMNKLICEKCLKTLVDTIKE